MSRLCQYGQCRGVVVQHFQGARARPSMRFLLSLIEPWPRFALPRPHEYRRCARRRRTMLCQDSTWGLCRAARRWRLFEAKRCELRNGNAAYPLKLPASSAASHIAGDTTTAVAAAAAMVPSAATAPTDGQMEGKDGRSPVKGKAFFPLPQK